MIILIFKKLETIPDTEQWKKKIIQITLKLKFPSYSVLPEARVNIKSKVNLYLLFSLMVGINDMKGYQIST